MLVSTGDSSVMTSSLNLMSKKNALEACDSYEVHQTPVGKAEDGVDAHTEVRWKLTGICCYSCEVLNNLSDALLNNTNIL